MHVREGDLGCRLTAVAVSAPNAVAPASAFHGILDALEGCSHPSRVRLRSHGFVVEQRPRLLAKV